MIRIKNLSFAYGDNEVLKDISFEVQPGECAGILGTNGAGKSTLITCLNKIHEPKTGEVYLDRQNILKMGRRETARCVSYVAQKNEISQITVFDSVLLGRKPYIKWTVSQEDIDLCDAMIEQVGLAKYKLKYINELSGGELQKVMLARALVQQPKLLLLDEPTSNLDPRNQYEMLALVQKMIREQYMRVDRHPRLKPRAPLLRQIHIYQRRHRLPARRRINHHGRNHLRRLRNHLYHSKNKRAENRDDWMMIGLIKPPGRRNKA
jgi:iron complex transport system ATP-binding protein